MHYFFLVISFTISRFIIFLINKRIMEKTGIIFDIKRYAVHDGPGIRTTVFLKGCPLECWWCHNPESQKLEPESFSENSNSCDEIPEKIGRIISVSEVMNEVRKDQIFYEESNGGVTFSGGEPLFQYNFLKELLKTSKEYSLHTTLDTAGCISKEKILQIAPLVDLFLYDIKLINDNKHIKYTGISNKDILANLIELSKRKFKIIIRIPIIPSINDDKDELDLFGKFIQPLNVEKVELLPFHTIGENKYSKLKKLNRMKDIQPPTRELMNEIKYHLESFNLTVCIVE